MAPAVKEQEQKTIILNKHWAMEKNYLLIYNSLVDRLRDKPYFVDLRNLLCSRPTPVCESDGMHLNPTGDRMVAAFISNFLKKQWGADASGERPGAVSPQAVPPAAHVKLSPPSRKIERAGGTGVLPGCSADSR